MHGVSEAGRRQNVDVPMLEFGWPAALPPSIHAGDFHLGRGFVTGRVFGQSRGLGFHDLQGVGFLGDAVRLEGKAPWRRESI